MGRSILSGRAVFDGVLDCTRARRWWSRTGGSRGSCPRPRRPAGERVALGGGVLAPGFIDLQVNGGGGVLLNDRPDVDGDRGDLRGARARSGPPGSCRR